ncbi:MAG: TetR/AcrR family transcriptional regulator [Cyanobacteria bacterium P01_F01_bin.143]
MRNLKKKSSKEELLDAAIAVLVTNPSASLSEVVKKAGVGRATLYRYFPTKEALIKEIALLAIKQTDEAIAPIVAKQLNSQETLHQMLEVIVPLGDRFHFLMSESSTYKDPEIAQAYNRQLKDLNTLVEGLKQEGFIAIDISNAWAIAVIDSLIWTAWYSVQTGYIAPKEAASLVYRTLIQGLQPKLMNRSQLLPRH